MSISPLIYSLLTYSLGLKLSLLVNSRLVARNLRNLACQADQTLSETMARKPLPSLLGGIARVWPRVWSIVIEIEGWPESAGSEVKRNNLSISRSVCIGSFDINQAAFKIKTRSPICIPTWSWLKRFIYNQRSFVAWRKKCVNRGKQLYYQLHTAGCRSHNWLIILGFNVLTPT